MSLYLKYRPQNFADLVGQEFIKNTLQTAIKDDKTVWGYLFTGPRGTGKTSTARIFAKAINCLTPKNGDACLTCEICTDFSENKLIDIIEIDAASHTGVDNIREIIERAQFQPTKTTYKIYIIDEVHMLSKWAFNALLKILEEPPEHVKFILATTEIHKVPETILSRLQRYDFKNHTPQDTRTRLEYIAKKEKVSIDDTSLDYIIKTANGGLRDAISLFEQLISNGAVTYEYIENTLWVSPDEEIQAFSQKLISLDSSIMDDIWELQSRGKNLQLFFKDVIHTLWKMAQEELLQGNNISHIIFPLDVLYESYRKSKNSPDEALSFSIGLLKILWHYEEPQSVPSPENPPVAKNPVVQETNKQENPPKTQEPPQEPTDTQEPPEIVEQETSLFTDAQEIFAPQEPAFDQERASADSQPSFSGSTVLSGDFDKEAFIQAVKESGAKWAVTMSLRGADFVLDKQILSIQFKTKVALGSVNTPESKEYLQRALEKLNKSDISLSLS